MSSSLSSSASSSSSERKTYSASGDGVATWGLRNNGGQTLSERTLQHDSVERIFEGANETSPLLQERREQNGIPEEDAEQGDPQRTRSLWYLILLTISIGGLQLAWSVELSNGSPYLLSLGVSKSFMALIWIAGPLTGTLVQPYVGMMSDNCKVSWGRRKPFMLGGAVITTISLMFLAWTREIVAGFLGLFGADPQSQAVNRTIIAVAVIWIYVLDFAINTVQAAIRAFIVDCAPAHQQEAANSMASRITGVGNIIGYCAGYVNLPKYAWWLGNTQFKVLCAIASIGLCVTIILSITFIPERDPRLDGPPAAGKYGIFDFFKKIFTSMKRLPPQIKKVCTVQFCAWVGFFPMLFYTSSYIAEVWIEPYLEANPHMTPEQLDVLYEQGTRIGTYALLIFAITSLATNVFLPFFIAPTYDNSPVAGSAPSETPGVVKESNSDKKALLDYLVIPGFTLRRAWLLSYIIYALAMFCTVLVRTVDAATTLIGLVGITWALTLWAPYAIISGEISRRDATMRARKHNIRSLAIGGVSDSTVEQYLDQESRLQQEEADMDHAGVILGIHNMAIAAPQILATVASSIIFRFTQKPRGVPGDHSFAIILALGGIFVLGASYFVYLINDDVPAVDTISTLEEGDAVASRPATAHSRKNMDTSHQSQQRATLARSTSFGTGLEY